MQPRVIDARGLKGPIPTLRMLNTSREMRPGEMMEVLADCPSFESDVRRFCDSMKAALLFVKLEGSAKRICVRL